MPYTGNRRRVGACPDPSSNTDTGGWHDRLHGRSVEILDPEQRERYKADRAGDRPGTAGGTWRVAPARKWKKRTGIMIIFDNPASVPAPAGQYSHVARVGLAGKTVLQLSGQVAVDADGKIVGTDMTTQAEFIMDNISAILAAHGATLADVVNLRTYLTDMSKLPDYGKVRTARFTTPPTITTVEVSRLFMPGALIEVEALAVI